MISGLDWPQKILKALLGFYTVFDCLWSCISYFFPAVCFLAKYNRSERMDCGLRCAAAWYSFSF